jgi:hypothetical protein
LQNFIEKEARKSKRKHGKRKSCGLLPDGKEASISKTLLKEKERKKHHKGSGGLSRWHRSIDFFKPNS